MSKRVIVLTEHIGEVRPVHWRVVIEGLGLGDPATVKQRAMKEIDAAARQMTGAQVIHVTTTRGGQTNGSIRGSEPGERATVRPNTPTRAPRAERPVETTSLDGVKLTRGHKKGIRRAAKKDPGIVPRSAVKNGRGEISVVLSDGSRIGPSGRRNQPSGDTPTPVRAVKAEAPAASNGRTHKPTAHPGRRVNVADIQPLSRNDMTAEQKTCLALFGAQKSKGWSDTELHKRLAEASLITAARSMGYEGKGAPPTRAEKYRATLKALAEEGAVIVLSDGREWLAAKVYDRSMKQTGKPQGAAIGSLTTSRYLDAASFPDAPAVTSADEAVEAPPAPQAPVPATISGSLAPSEPESFPPPETPPESRTSLPGSHRGIPEPWQEYAVDYRDGRKAGQRGVSAFENPHTKASTWYARQRSDAWEAGRKAGARVRADANAPSIRKVLAQAGLSRQVPRVTGPQLHVPMPEVPPPADAKAEVERPDIPGWRWDALISAYLDPFTDVAELCRKNVITLQQFDHELVKRGVSRLRMRKLLEVTPPRRGDA